MIQLKDKVAEWIKKKTTKIHLPKRNSYQSYRYIQTESESWKILLHANRKEKQARVVTHKTK